MKSNNYFFPQFVFSVFPKLHCDVDAFVGKQWVPYDNNNNNNNIKKKHTNKSCAGQLEGHGWKPFGRIYSLVRVTPLLAKSSSANAGLSAPVSKSGGIFFSMSRACRRAQRTFDPHARHTHHWQSQLCRLAEFHRDVETKRNFTSDFAPWLKQIKSLFLTNRSGLSLFCLHPPEKKKETSPSWTVFPSLNSTGLCCARSCLPVIALTSRPHTMVVSVPTRDR